MKRSISIVILGAMVIGIAAVVLRTLMPPSPTGSEPGPEVQPPFAIAIRVGEERFVRFRADAEAIEQLAPDAIEEQLRDWLLYAVMAESGLDGVAFRNAMYDLPPTRAAYVSPIAAFNFGPARFRVVDESGATIVLIPAPDPAHPDRIDLLAQIADAVRTRLGIAPPSLQVFEYVLDPVTFSARVTRTPDVPGERLFTPEYGYVEADVRTGRDLDAFLSQTRDIVWASLLPDGTRLGGRKPKTEMRPMRVEDVAAIWQSEREIARPQEGVDILNARWRDGEYAYKAVNRVYQRKRTELLKKYPDLHVAVDLPSGSDVDAYRKELERKLQQILKSGVPNFPDPLVLPPDANDLLKAVPPKPSFDIQPPAKSPAEAALHEFNRRWENPEYQKTVAAEENRREFEALLSQFQQAGMERVADHSGFSLDSAFDYTKLLGLFRAHRGALASVVQEARLSEAETAIGNRQEGPFLKLLNELKQAGNQDRLVASIQEEFGRVSFQRARYDGLLKGTDVGMVLFYTDLLAKLWALDYHGSAPDKADTSHYVAGFVPRIKVWRASIYEKEAEQLTGTRLWFGPRDSAFVKTATAMSFAPVATRVYAASLNQLVPGDETEASVASATFLNWWNDHYSEIAAFEPEYQRLNQIMKWSILIAWLHSERKLDQFHFLSPAHVRVSRDHWFPDWAKSTPNLRFRDWQVVSFLPAGHQGTQTEALETLRWTSFLGGGGFRTLQGGVSLADRSRLQARPTLVTQLPSVVRRPNIGEVASDTADAFVFRSTDDTSFTGFTFKPAEHRDRAGVTVRASRTFRDADTPEKTHEVPVKLRGSDTEVRAGNFDIDFTKTDSGVTTRVVVNARPIASLSIERRGRDIDVLYAPLDIENSRSLSNTLNGAIAHLEDPSVALARRPDVKRVIAVDQTFYVESALREGWLKITSEGAPRADIAKGVDLRTAGASWSGSTPSPRWNVVFVGASQVDAELSRLDQSVFVRTTTPESRGIGYALSAKPPPPPLSSIDVRGKSSPLQVLNGGDGKLPPPPADSRRFSFRNQDGRPPIVMVTDAGRRDSLDRSDELLKAGRFREARLELDLLVMAFADDPEIRSRRVIAHAASGSPLAAAEASRLNLSQDHLQAFLDVADVAGGHLAPTSDTRRELDAIVRGVVAKVRGYATAYIRDPKTHELGIELRVRDSWQPVPESPARPEFALYVIEATPAIASGPIPIDTASITGKLRIPAAAVFPEVLVDAEGKRYRRQSASMTASRARSTFRDSYGTAGPDAVIPPSPPPPPTSPPCESLSGDDLDARTDCDEEVYLIARRDHAVRQ